MSLKSLLCIEKVFQTALNDPSSSFVCEEVYVVSIAQDL